MCFIYFSFQHLHLKLPAVLCICFWLGLLSVGWQNNLAKSDHSCNCQYMCIFCLGAVQNTNLPNTSPCPLQLFYHVHFASLEPLITTFLLYLIFLSSQCCLLTTGFGNTVNGCTLLTIMQVFQYARWGKNSFDGTFIFHISDCLLWKTPLPWWAHILPLLFDCKPLKLQVRSLIWKLMAFEDESSLHFLYATTCSRFVNDTLRQLWTVWQQNVLTQCWYRRSFTLYPSLISAALSQHCTANQIVSRR